MRRLTPGTIEFGKYLYITRNSKGISQREVARRLKIPAATISQVESGKRALKEWRISDWAKAYEIGERTFRTKWKECEAIYAEPITRIRRATVPKDRFDELANSLTAAERQRVAGYIEAILEERNNAI